MAIPLDDLPASFLASLDEFQLGILTDVRSDGSPHATVVGFTYDPDQRVARVITRSTSHKARHIGDGGPVTLTQQDGRFWMTLEGKARVATDMAEIEEAKRRYTARYGREASSAIDAAIVVDVHRAYGMYAPPDGH